MLVGIVAPKLNLDHDILYTPVLYCTYLICNFFFFLHALVGSFVIALRTV